MTVEWEIDREYETAGMNSGVFDFFIFPREQDEEFVGRVYMSSNDTVLFTKRFSTFEEAKRKLPHEFLYWLRRQANVLYWTLHPEELGREIDREQPA